MVCGKNMVCGQNIFAVHKCSDTHTKKTCLLFLIKLPFFTTEIILAICSVYLCFRQVSYIIRYVLYASNKILWNSIARKPVVGKFALRMSRPLLHISLVQTCAVRLCELCISCKYICRAAQMRRLVRTYLVRTFSSLVQKEGFFFVLFLIPEKYSQRMKCAQSH